MMMKYHANILHESEILHLKGFYFVGIEIWNKIFRVISYFNIFKVEWRLKFW